MVYSWILCHFHCIYVQNNFFFKDVQWHTSMEYPEKEKKKKLHKHYSPIHKWYREFDAIHLMLQRKLPTQIWYQDTQKLSSAYCK